MADPLLPAIGITTVAAVLIDGLLPDASGHALPDALVWSGAHVPVYAVFVVLAGALLTGEPDGLLVSVLLVSIIGMGVEIAQPFMGRAAGFVDYLSNEVGVVTGAMIVQWYRRHAGTRAGEESKE